MNNNNNKTFRALSENATTLCRYTLCQRECPRLDYDDVLWCEQMWTHTSKAEGVSRHRAKAKTNDVLPSPYASVHARRNTRIELAGKKRQLERAVNMWRRQMTGQRLDARCGFLFLLSQCWSHTLCCCYYYIDDNQLGSPFGMIPYGFNAKWEVK